VKPTPLQEELKQIKPFVSLEEEVHVAVMRTAAVVERQLAQALKPFGLTLTQYNVLRILRGAGDEGLCRNEVGQRLIREVPDVTRLLDRMKRQKLIRRHRSASDRRMVRTEITPKGLEILAQLDQTMRVEHSGRLSHLGCERLQILVETLADMRKAVT
jgi:DNA-binding MarR family transcriptional regulator